MSTHSHESDAPPADVRVWPALPKWHPALKPAVVWVACPQCGHPVRTYFGPTDRDERQAEVDFLRGEVARLYEMMQGEREARMAVRDQWRARQEVETAELRSGIERLRELLFGALSRRRRRLRGGDGEEAR